MAARIPRRHFFMMYAFSFLLIAAGLLWLAVTHQGLEWLLLWPVLSFSLVGLAYAGLGPWVFGKRADGTLNPFNIAILLPFLLYSWMIWFLQTHLTSEPAFHQIARGLWLGRRVHPNSLPPSVTTVVDLTSEFSVPRRMREGRNYQCLPTLDHESPAREAFQQMTAQLGAQSGHIYLHCALGHGRSAMLAAALLVARSDEPDVNAAIAHLQRIRPRVKLSASQKRALDQWQRDQENGRLGYS